MERFAVITHSTGGPIVRIWWEKYYLRKYLEVTDHENYLALREEFEAHNIETMRDERVEIKVSQYRRGGLKIRAPISDSA